MIFIQVILTLNLCLSSSCCRNDGSFTISVPSGSYTIDVAHPYYVFDSIRVDINSKGKIRARRLNNVQPSLVLTVTYPLKIKAKGRANYFQQREQWRITDFLFSPMVWWFTSAAQPFRILNISAFVHLTMWRICAYYLIGVNLGGLGVTLVYLLFCVW